MTIEYDLLLSNDLGQGPGVLIMPYVAYLPVCTGIISVRRKAGYLDCYLRLCVQCSVGTICLQKLHMDLTQSP